MDLRALESLQIQMMPQVVTLPLAYDVSCARANFPAPVAATESGGCGSHHPILGILN
jgi:hypothetical protein